MSELISKWHMHRLGLVDFWYYVNEEFSFKDGHMLLRGSNGSGKSVTMQSLYHCCWMEIKAVSVWILLVHAHVK